MAASVVCRQQCEEVQSLQGLKGSSGGVGNFAGWNAIGKEVEELKVEGKRGKRQHGSAEFAEKRKAKPIP
jgi:hypothetical protein